MAPFLVLICSVFGLERFANMFHLLLAFMRFGWREAYMAFTALLFTLFLIAFLTLSLNFRFCFKTPHPLLGDFGLSSLFLFENLVGLFSHEFCSFYILIFSIWSSRALISSRYFFPFFISSSKIYFRMSIPL